MIDVLPQEDEDWREQNRVNLGEIRKKLKLCHKSLPLTACITVRFIPDTTSLRPEISLSTNNVL